MIDLARERPIPLPDAVALVPRSGGRTIHAGTLYRWARHGLSGVRLETVRLGRQLCTSQEAIQRFSVQLSEAVDGKPVVHPPTKAERAARQAAAEQVFRRAAASVGVRV